MMSNINPNVNRDESPPAAAMDSSKKPTKPNPLKKANFISRLLFLWIAPLLSKGKKEGLGLNDLTRCMPMDKSKELGNKLEKQWLKEISRARRKKKQPQLKNAMLRTFWFPCVIDGFICFIHIIIKSITPAILGQLLLQFQVSLESVSVQSNIGETIKGTLLNRTTKIISKMNNRTKTVETQAKNNIAVLMKRTLENTGIEFDRIWNDIYWLASILVIVTLIGYFLNHHVDLRQRLLGARMRIACCSLVYRKTLKLSKTVADRIQAEYLLDLLSNHVNQLDVGFIYMHYIWIFPIQSIFICYLLWQKIGSASVIGVVALLLQTAPVQTSLRRLFAKLRKKIAQRSGKRVGIMSEIVRGIKVIKMHAWEKPFRRIVAEARRREIKQIRHALYLRAFNLSTKIFTERSTLFMAISAALALGRSMKPDLAFSMMLYYNSLQLIAAALYPKAVSFGAEALISIDRIQDFLVMDDHDENVNNLKKITDKYAIESNSKAIVFNQVNAKWDNKKLTPALRNMNLHIKKGQLCAVIGPVGAGKSSLLQLLLGELPISSGNVVINGDVSYASQEPWLFTGTVRNNILFGENYDRKRYHEITKCCALAADFEQLLNGDKTVVGERGASLSGGQRARISLARAVYKQAAIYLFDDPLSAVDAHVGKHLFDEVIGPRSRLANEKSTRLLVTHQVHFLTEADWIVIVEDGRILRQGTYIELANSDLDFAKLLERPASKRDSESNDGYQSEDMTIYEDEDIPYIDGVKGYQMLRQRSSSSISTSFRKSTVSDKNFGENQEVAEEEAEGEVSGRVWWKYFHAGANIASLCLLVFVMLSSQIVISGSDYFLSIWTHQEYLRTVNEIAWRTTYECLYTYGLLIMAVVVITITRGYLFSKMCIHASKMLHDRMFGSILRAKMRFFDANTVDRILKRFSKDLSDIDEHLPVAMMEFIQVALIVLGILTLITIVNPILTVALAVAVFVYAFVLRMYIRSSQDLNRLEGICRTPVFSHVSSTLSGISTIRSRLLQTSVVREFDDLQDVHSAVWHLTISANNALGLWLDCINCGLLATVVISFISLYQYTDVFSGNIGLAISQAMILAGKVQHSVQRISETLQRMTSVQRVLQYAHIDQEPEVKNKPPKNWPSKGNVHIKNLSLCYDSNSPIVLKSLNISIKPGWKVGIVGRTGAGKSSLISALFRLSNIEGEIFIDDIETGTISLESLRSKISIVPQDPVLFSATIRYNLDPFELYSDSELWQALGEVELKQSIPSLDYIVTERGCNFSLGQKQLVCLARAILRNNKVLVLDEATANVDPHTEDLIQRIIRDKFKQCTVLMIAHRLHTIMDSDRILVMEEGKVKEFDMPHILLMNPNGVFRQIVEATGVRNSENLKQIANETYKQKHI